MLVFVTILYLQLYMIRDAGHIMMIIENFIFKDIMQCSRIYRDNYSGGDQ